MENWRTKKNTQTKKNIKIPRYQDTGMARPDTPEIGGLKKKRKERKNGLNTNPGMARPVTWKIGGLKKRQRRRKKSIELSEIFFHQFYYRFSRPYTTWPE